MNHVLAGCGVKRVLVLGSNHVGNNIFCTPAIRYLKRVYPAVAYDALSTSIRGADAFRGNPDLSGVHLAFLRRRVQRIAADYDLVIGMYRDLANDLLRDCTVPRVVIEPDASLHRADQRLEFAKSLCGAEIVPDDRHYTVAWNQPHLAAVETRLTSAADSDCRIGLHLGCGRTAVHGWKFWYPGRDRDARLWSLQNYVALAHQIRRVLPRVQFVITGSRNETFLARRFMAAVTNTVDFVGRTSIQSVAALMSRLQLMITQDNGILHVACATDVPLIALFGPTRIEAVGPYPRRDHHTVIKRDTMAAITPDEVSAAAVEVIRRSTSRVENGLAETDIEFASPGPRPDARVA